MTTVPLRTRITEGVDELVLAIPTRKNYFHRLLLALWLLLWGWSLFAVVGSASRLGGESTGVVAWFFLLSWLASWLIGGGIALYGFLWMCCGEELLVVRPEAVILQRRLLGFGQPKVYRAASIDTLRLAPPEKGFLSLVGSWRLFGFGSGILAFNYGVRVVTFGEGITPAEGAILLERLRQTAVFAPQAQSEDEGRSGDR